MNPPVFEILSTITAIKNIFGNNPIRIYPYGEAPQKCLRPYATYSVYNGTPENYLDRVPDIDNLGTQVDIWADSADTCTAAAIAVRDGLEPKAHMTGFTSNEVDPETKLFRTRMDFDFFKKR